MLELFEYEINEAPTNANDFNFLQSHTIEFGRLKTLLKCVAYPSATPLQKNQQELIQLVDKFYKDLKKELASIRSIKLSDISIELAEMKDSVLSVPGTYAARYVRSQNVENEDDKTEKTEKFTSYLNNENSSTSNEPTENGNYELITISSFHPALELITSKQYPRLVVINGSDGCQHTSLLKGQEDLRLDQNVMQFFELINMHIENSFPPESRHLRVHTYSITPLSNMSGLIQFIDNTDTLLALISLYRQQRGIPVNIEETICNDNYSKISSLTPIQRFEFLNFIDDYKIDDTKSLDGNDLREIIWLKSGNAFNWIMRTSRFTQTSAIVSIVGYILGLGDRHPSNIMMHRLSGDVIHIDLGDCFEVGKKEEKIPRKSSI